MAADAGHIPAGQGLARIFHEIREICGLDDISNTTDGIYVKNILVIGTAPFVSDMTVACAGLQDKCRVTCTTIAPDDADPQNELVAATAAEQALVLTNSPNLVRPLLRGRRAAAPPCGAILLYAPGIAPETAQSLHREARKSRIPLSLAHPGRCHSALARFREILDSGALGEITAIELGVHTHRGIWPPSREAGNGTTTVSWAYHAADILSWLLHDTGLNTLAETAPENDRQDMLFRLERDGTPISLRVHALGADDVDLSCNIHAEGGNVAWSGPAEVTTVAATAVARTVRGHRADLSVPVCNPVTLDVALQAQCGMRADWPARVAPAAELAVLNLRDLILSQPR
jgi:hypothetical protein